MLPLLPPHCRFLYYYYDHYSYTDRRSPYTLREHTPVYIYPYRGTSVRIPMYINKRAHTCTRSVCYVCTYAFTHAFAPARVGGVGALRRTSAVHFDWIDGSVVVVCVHQTDALSDFHARLHAAKDSVFTVKVGGRPQGDKEL